MLSELTEVMGEVEEHTMLASPGYIQVAFWRQLGPPSWSARLAKLQNGNASSAPQASGIRCT